MASSLNSPTPQERWHRFTAATVRAFHRYATWLVSLSWWRFGWYALVLIIVTGLLQKLPPFSLTYYETIVDSASHRKARMRTPPSPPSMPAIAMPEHPAQPEQPEHPEKVEPPEKPEKPQAPPSPTPAPSPKPDDSKSVDIKLPGIVVNGKDHTVKNKGVNITFTSDGIHISSDDGADEAAANAKAASAAASAVQAAKALEAATAAKAGATTARERAEAAKLEAAARRDMALAEAMTQKAAAEAARAARLGGVAASAAAQASSAAPAATAAASQAAVDMVVGGQHVRIDVPTQATAEEVRDAIEQARSAIVEQIQDDAEKRRAAEQEAADRATEQADKARQHDDEDDDGDSSDNKHRTMHARTINTVPLSMLAVWWILGSMLIKITYKGRMQAEVKAAEATETAEAESLRRQVLEARMAMMQAQVEPHFLFNTLASIDHLIEFDPKRASQMQRNLISLLRASMPSMRSTDSGLRPLDLELAVVRPYLEILKVRMEERLTTEIDVPDGLLSAEFPPMMIQTLVENSIKHGLEPKAEGGHLSVKAEIRHGKLAVTVCDTGLGFEAAAQGSTHGTGVGLANIRERLALLYGPKASLTIANNPVGGTIVTITVPYTTHTESDEGAKA
ncbi:MAG TPA: histidine kinase [Burkholderiaceae bacterium]